jgi:hypothetical protein
MLKLLLVMLLWKRPIKQRERWTKLTNSSTLLLITKHVGFKHLTSLRQLNNDLLEMLLKLALSLVTAVHLMLSLELFLQDNTSQMTLLADQSHSQKISILQVSL